MAPQQNLETELEESTFTQTSGSVLAHCGQGISRSATIVVAYLMRKHHAKAEVVLKEVRKKRKVKPNANFMGQLEIWDQVGYQIWEDADKKLPKEPYRAYLERREADLKAKGLTGTEPISPQNL